MPMTSAAAHVVLGGGPVGTAIARELAEAGEAVRVVTRTGRDVGIPGVTPFPADITDPSVVRAATGGSRPVEARRSALPAERISVGAPSAMTSPERMTTTRPKCAAANSMS